MRPDAFPPNAGSEEEPTGFDRKRAKWRKRREIRYEVEGSGVKWGHLASRGAERGSVVSEHGLGPTGVFLGTFTPRLDDKGRLILPAKFRGRLSSGLVMTRGLDRCIFVFPIDEFNAIHDRLRRAPLENKNARDYLRNFLGFASDEIPDKQGRVLVGAPLRAYAGIDREVAVVGLGSRVEIWDQAAWQEYLVRGEDDYAATAAEVFQDM